MEGNMHQARSSKEMQYEGKSCWSSSLFYISAQPQYKDENKQKAWSHAQTPWQEEQGWIDWWNIYHGNICRNRQRLATDLRWERGCSVDPNSSPTRLTMRFCTRSSKDKRQAEAPAQIGDRQYSMRGSRHSCQVQVRSSLRHVTEWTLNCILSGNLF